MKYFLFPMVAFVIVCTTSCGHENSSSKVSTLAENLKRSNTYLGDMTRQEYNEMTSDTTDLKVAFKAKYYLPKAESVRHLSEKARKSIDNIERIFTYYYYNVDKNAGNTIISTGMAKELFQALLNYKVEVLRMMSVEPVPDNDIWTKSFDMNMKALKDPERFLQEYSYGKPKEDVIKNWSDSNFRDSNAAEAIAMLEKFRNDIYYTELSILKACHSYTKHDVIYRWSTIATLSSNYVKGGDSIEAFVGVGEFINPIGMQIIINGKIVEPQANGPGKRKVKVPTEPGKYVIKVKVIWRDQAGILTEWNRDLKYEVAK